jgi:hypothetical protein
VSGLHEQARVAWAVDATSGIREDRRTELCRRLGTTQGQLESLLEQGREAGVLVRGGGIELTATGKYLAEEMRVGMQELQVAERRLVRSYLEYTPKRWYPERRR